MGSTDKDINKEATDDQLAPNSQLPDPSRRRFSRSAIAGSAVLLSLGNRAAWGQTPIGCMSLATLNSFNPSTGSFVSAPGGRPQHNEELAQSIHDISNAPDYLGSSTVPPRISCQDPSSIDSVCLYPGNTCP